jgi:hypothetical protein
MSAFMSKINIAFALVCGLAAVAPAQAQRTPAERYMLSVAVEAIDGSSLYRASKECDPAAWCKVEGGRFTVAGKERYFAVQARLIDGTLRYRWFFPVVAAPQSSKRQVMGEMPFRRQGGETRELFDSDDGRQLAVLRTPKIATLHLKIAY